MAEYFLSRFPRLQQCMLCMECKTVAFSFTSSRIFLLGKDSKSRRAIPVCHDAIQNMCNNVHSLSVTGSASHVVYTLKEHSSMRIRDCPILGFFDMASINLFHE